jgi:hypothetical protein
MSPMPDSGSPDPIPVTKPWGLATWRPDTMMAAPQYFATRAEALAAAPTDAPFTIVDVTARTR